jgi:hypothetical protein
MSKTSCASRCSSGSVQGVLRAPAEGEGGVAHREDLAASWWWWWHHLRITSGGLPLNGGKYVTGK